MKCLWTKPTHATMDLSVTLLCWCTVFWKMKYKFLIKTPCAFYPTSQCPDYSSSFLGIFLWYPIGYLRFLKAATLVSCQGLLPWLRMCACVWDLVQSLRRFSEGVPEVCLCLPWRCRYTVAISYLLKFDRIWKTFTNKSTELVKAYPFFVKCAIKTQDA